MFDSERSAYPHPDEFKVMRPEYLDPDPEDEEDTEVVAIITIPPFRVTGRSVTRAGARRAALYEAAQTYRNYHPSYRVESPFPNAFEDAEGTRWTRVAEHLRPKLGDYSFLLEGEEEEDYADIDQMLSWDVRPQPVYEDEDEE